jgi:hypothetical protein
LTQPEAPTVVAKHMTATRTMGTPDDLRCPQEEGGISPPTDRDSRPPSEQQSAPALSGSERRPPNPGRWHNVARLLVIVWAWFTSLAIIISFSVIPLDDPSATGHLWTTCAALATLTPWAVVFLVWRWPSLGAVALLAAFFLYLVLACGPAGLSFWAFLLFFPTLLILPATAALGLHLTGHRAARPGRDRQPSPSLHD